MGYGQVRTVGLLEQAGRRTFELREKENHVDFFPASVARVYLNFFMKRIFPPVSLYCILNDSCFINFYTLMQLAFFFFFGNIKRKSTYPPLCKTFYSNTLCKVLNFEIGVVLHYFVALKKSHKLPS